jgi:uncharacterized protein with HEPN domain
MSEREWRFYIDDMLKFASNALAYSEGLNQAAFVASGLNYDATLRNIELIGEAATHIPDEVRVKYPQIQWRMIVATRNRLIHGYLGVDDDTVWSIITDELPELLAQLTALKNDIED